MNRRMDLPAPPVLDPERLQEEAYTVRGQSNAGKVIVHYDPFRICGGVFFFAAEVWSIWGPLPFHEFVAALDSRGIQIAESDSLERWVAACSVNAQRGTSH